MRGARRDRSFHGDRQVRNAAAAHEGSRTGDARLHADTPVAVVDSDRRQRRIERRVAAHERAAAVVRFASDVGKGRKIHNHTAAHRRDARPRRLHRKRKQRVVFERWISGAVQNNVAAQLARSERAAAHEPGFKGLIRRPAIKRCGRDGKLGERSRRQPSLGIELLDDRAAIEVKSRGADNRAALRQGLKSAPIGARGQREHEGD